MNTENRILIFSGLGLLAMTMLFGVGYALFDEHQTLVGMGTSMAEGFTQAATGDMNAAFAALERYGLIGQEYRREVHAHGHWGMLGLILLVYGLVIQATGYSAPTRVRLAALMAICAFAFPLGVLLQIGPAAALGQVLSMVGSVGMIAALLILVLGVLRTR